MREKTRWGILGPGTISRKFATGLKTIPEAEITAVGSRDLQRANAFADTFNIPHRHGNYTDLAHNPEVDIIYVATHTPFTKSVGCCVWRQERRFSVKSLSL